MSSAIRRNRTGFTLIEMLIVVVVIGILASVAVARFNRVKQRGQMAAVQSDLRNISVAQEGYHMENMTYTNDPDDLEFDITSGVIITITAATSTGWAATGTHAGDALDMDALGQQLAARKAKLTEQFKTSGIPAPELKTMDEAPA